MRFTSAAAGALLLLAVGCGGGGAKGAGSTAATPADAKAKVAATAGDTSTTLVEFDGDVGDLAIDATHVYITLPSEGSIKRVAKIGGVIEPVAEDQPDPDQLLVVGKDVYWTTYEDGRGEIRHWSHKKDKWTTVALDSGEIRAIASRGDEIVYVVVTQSGAKVRAVPQAGGAYRELANGDASSFLAVSGDEVCWGGGYKLWRSNGKGAPKLVSDEFQLLGLAALDGDVFAWDASSVRLIALDQPPTKIAEGTRPVVAANQRFVIIADGGGGALRVRTADGKLMDVVGHVSAEHLVADEDAAYWTSKNNGQVRIERHELPGGRTAQAVPTKP